MTDRSGQAYLVLTRGTQFVCLLSPSRQAAKQLHLSGRQRRKYRKAKRHGA